MYIEIVKLSTRRISEAHGIMLANPDGRGKKFFFQFFHMKPVDKLVSVKNDECESIYKREMKCMGYKTYYFEDDYLSVTNF